MIHVTGGAAFIVGHLVEALAAVREEEAVLDNYVSGAPSNLQGEVGKAGNTFKYLKPSPFINDARCQSLVSTRDLTFLTMCGTYAPLRKSLSMRRNL